VSLHSLLDPRTARFLPWLVAVAFFMQALDGTILNTALPAMAHELGEDPLRMHGVILAYLITVAILIPASGWLADRFGSRRIFFMAILLFTAGSLLCTFVNSLNTLMAARIVQAIGGALMMPVGRLVVLRAYPRSELVKVMSFITLPGLVGPLIGPTIGGWLVEFASWRWIFALNLPIGLIGAVATYKLMPDLRPEKTWRFDTVGFVLFGAFTLSIIVGIESLAGNTLFSPLWMVLLALAALLLYGLHAARKKHPLFALSLFRVRSFTVGILANLLSRLGSSAMPFLTPLMLQVGMGYSPSVAGMSMIPLTLAGMASKTMMNWMIGRFGYRRILLINTPLQSLLLAGMALVSASTPWPVLLVLLCLIGACTYIQYTALSTFTLTDLDNQQASSGTSLMSVTIQLAIGLAISLAGAMLALFNPEQGSWPQANLMDAFACTYLGLAVLTLLATALFLYLPKKLPGVHL
jgi:EmrB/QacA subfamily drug resistance transporter